VTSEATFEDLTQTERMTLMRFVCSFAWADLEIQTEERRFVSDLVRGLELKAEEKAAVEGWLTRPPSEEEVNPDTIPKRHRALFLAAVECVIQVDGQVTPEEAESFEVLQRILGFA